MVGDKRFASRGERLVQPARLEHVEREVDEMAAAQLGD